MRKPISSYNALLYYLTVKARRIARYINWIFGKQKFARTISMDKLKFRVYKHQSVLVRKMGGADLRLQLNKVRNLRIAVEKLNGIIIYPGETFSFWRLIGCATRKKGYLDGMLLSNGEAMAGIGGGICQIANLIHWLCLHSPLTVTERHHHSFDPFPDEGRVVPFGSGASVFYNYMDYRFINNTDHIFQLLFWFDDKCINGDLRSDYNFPYKYHVFEKDHEFVKIGENFFRRNELWRDKYLKREGGRVVETELIQKNDALVKYVPEEYRPIGPGPSPTV